MFITSQIESLRSWWVKGHVPSRTISFVNKVKYRMKAHSEGPLYLLFYPFIVWNSPYRKSMKILFVLPTFQYFFYELLDLKQLRSFIYSFYWIDDIPIYPHQFCSITKFMFLYIKKCNYLVFCNIWPYINSRCGKYMGISITPMLAFKVFFKSISI